MDDDRIQELTTQDIIDQKARLIEVSGLRQDFIDNKLEQEGLEATCWWLQEHNFWYVAEGLKNFYFMMGYTNNDTHEENQ